MRRSKRSTGLPVSPVYILYFVAVLIILLGLRFVKETWHPVTVVGTSMLPTYRSGEIVATESYSSPADVQVNDVVIAQVAADDGKQLIKRVVGLPGDVIQIANGCIYRNSILIEEDFPYMEDAGVAAKPYHIPEGYFFLLGDNRNNSIDSRVFGPVSYEELYGKVTGPLFGQH